MLRIVSLESFPRCDLGNYPLNRGLWWKKKKLIEKSRECHNHKPQPTPTPSGRGKWQKLTCTKQTNRCTRSTQTSSLFPKRGDHNAKRNDETRGQRAREELSFERATSKNQNQTHIAMQVRRIFLFGRQWDTIYILRLKDGATSNNRAHDLAIGLDRRQQVDAILLDFSKAAVCDWGTPWTFLLTFLIRFPIIALQSSSITMASETKTYHGSKVFSRIEISKWSLMGRHHLLLLSHPEFHRTQCLDLSCSWYTSMTCPQEFPLHYDFLLMIFYCTELYETNRMQRYYRQILITYRNGKENGKCFLTQTSANIYGSPTSERSYRLPTTFTDRPWMKLLKPSTLESL